MVRKKPRKKAKVFRGPTKPEKNFVRAWRLFRGMEHQGDLAIAAGLSRPTISRVESGDLQWRQDLYEQIASALGCSAVDLLTTDPETSGSIFQIYATVPTEMRAKAQAAAIRALQPFLNK